MDLDLKSIESDLTVALKSKNSLETEVLRALKTRIQNQKIAAGKDLTPEDIIQLVSSEVKRRKEAAKLYTDGNRQELADKELAEVVVLNKYLPAQVSVEEIANSIEAVLASGEYTAKDFGRLMAELKTKFGQSADGATLSKVLKEKLAN